MPPTSFRALLTVLVLAAGVLVGSGPVATAAPAVEAAATPCFIPADGLDRCRDYLGASVGDDPSVGGDETAQFALHEQRYGAQRIVHLFSRAACHLTSFQRSAAERPGGYLFLNWRPVVDAWSRAAGGDATVNACIATMADDVAALGRPIFLALWHEAGIAANRQALVDADCPYSLDADGNRVYPASGTLGTAADYHGMWSNVQSIFSAHGATNVWWAYVTLSDTHHLCMTNALYPTGSKVDWIGIDQYGAANVPSFAANADRMTRWLHANSTAAHPFDRRPWALAEWGWQDARTSTDPSGKLAYYTGAAVAVRDHSQPAIHMYLTFDNLSGSSQPFDTRIAYVDNTFCAACVRYYANFARLVRDSVH